MEQTTKTPPDIFNRESQKKSINEIIGRILVDTRETLEAILHFDYANEESFKYFLRAINSNELVLRVEDQPLMFECFLNLLGFKNDLRSLFFLEKYIERQKISEDIEGFFFQNSDISNLKMLFSICVSVEKLEKIRNMAETYLRSSTNLNEKNSILAYILLAFYMKRISNIPTDISERAREIEIYNIIEYILGDQEKKTQILVKWPKCLENPNNKVKRSEFQILGLEDGMFFWNELEWMTNKNSVEEVIKGRKSHYLLERKLDLFLKNRSENMEEIHKEESILNYFIYFGKKKRNPSNEYGDGKKIANEMHMVSLVVESYKKEEKKYTEKILSRISDENAIRRIIKDLNLETDIFYKCETVDGDYLDGLRSNWKALEKIKDNIFQSLLKNPMLYHVTNEYEVFQRFIDESLRRGLEIEPELFLNSKYKTNRRYVSETKSKRDCPKNLLDTRLRGLVEDEQNDDVSGNLKKICYMLEKKIEICRKVIWKNIPKRYPRSENKRRAITWIALRSRDFKLVKIIFKKDKELFIQEIGKISDYSIFYMDVMKYLVSKGVGLSYFRILDCFTRYGLVLKDMMMVGSLQRTCICSLKQFSHEICERKEDIGLDILNKGSNTDDEEIVEKNLSFTSVNFPLENKYGLNFNECMETFGWNRQNRDEKIKRIYDEIEEGIYFYKSSLAVGPLSKDTSFCWYEETIIEESERLNVILNIDQYQIVASKNTITLYFQSSFIKRLGTVENEVSQSEAFLPKMYRVILRIKLQDRILKINVNGFQNRIRLDRNKTVENISIGEDFEGGIKYIMYHRGKKEFDIKWMQDSRDMWKKYIYPIEWVLKDERKKGFVLVDKNPYFFNEIFPIRYKNIILYRKALNIQTW